VTGRDHRAVQRYIIGLITGAVPRRFLVAIRALVEFRYLSQAPTFTEDSLTKVTNALQTFHDHKDTITRADVQSNWEIPKMELLQSVVRSICLSGVVMQWSADPTEHAHVQEIKAPARVGNNQNYYSQIARHLDRSEKCFQFDIATFLEFQATTDEVEDNNNVFDEEELPEQGPDSADALLTDHMVTTRAVVNYFQIAEALAHEASTLFNIPDLHVEIWEFLHHVENREPHPVPSNGSPGSNFPLPFNRLQVWHKIRVQQMHYHNHNTPDSPQTLQAIPPSDTTTHGLYDSVIASAGAESDWPLNGLEGHSVVQLQLMFCPLHTNILAAYVQRFDVVPQQGSMTDVHPGTGMHLIRRAVRMGNRVGQVISLTRIRSPAHLIPNFGKEAHSRLKKLHRMSSTVKSRLLTSHATPLSLQH
ncbi:hypothetical protein BDN67DRAFT_986268, partial [Paxillus ammoniavirescens]